MTDDGHDDGGVEGMSSSLPESGRFSSLSIPGSVINKPEGLGFDSHVVHIDVEPKDIIFFVSGLSVLCASLTSMINRLFVI